jgi:hypothetical protein
MRSCKPGVLVRCIRCGGRNTTENMAKRAADYYRAAVGVKLRRIVSNMMLGVTVDLSLSWLSMYFSSSLAYVLCYVCRSNDQSGLCSASGSGCKLTHILHYISIYLIVVVGARSRLWMY